MQRRKTENSAWHVSFITRKGCVNGPRRSPGFASQDVNFRSNELSLSIRLLQPAFPGCHLQISPVTGCVVLAYSCAAARDLHPLPIGRLVAGLRSCANLILRKSKNRSPANLPVT